MTDTTTTVVEVQWGFRHPGFKHITWSMPHVETQYTGHDGWTTGPYTEENIRTHAAGRPVVKRTITTVTTTTEWEEVQ